MAASSEPILIAGAGIAGLTAALALARRDIRVIVLEREAGLSEVGAGIQLSPNASRILIDLGLEAALQRSAVAPEALLVRSGRSGKLLATMPLGEAMRRRFGAPYWVIHRADLQAALVAAVAAETRIDLRLNHEIAGFSIGETGVRVDTAARETHEGAALVGADGVRSVIRGQLVGDGPPPFSGYVAWRGLVETGVLPQEDRRCSALWLGPNAHLVHYPVRGGDQVNVVAIVSSAEPAPGWGEAADAAALLLSYRGWAEPARALIGRVPAWQRFGLVDRAPLRAWSRGPVTLVGDAAHPTLPFLAQGGAMAIEDAAVLAAELAGRPNDPAAAFLRYETRRRGRTARLRRAARLNGRIFHLAAPAAFVRDLMLRILPPAAFAARHDWVYSWRAED